MKERAKETRRSSKIRKRRTWEDGENEVMESILKMAEVDREMAIRIHSIIVKNR